MRCLSGAIFQKMCLNVLKKWRVMNPFYTYSYFNNLVVSIIDHMPPYLRDVIFKMVFKNFGTGSFIDYKFYFRYGQKISIGRNVTINRGCTIYPSYKVASAFVIIRDNAVLSPQVTLIGAGHEINSLQLPDKAASIEIGENCFIGTGAIIRYGVTLGEGSVVASGSVVVKDVPPWSVVAGIPAKVIKNRIITN